MEVTAVQSIKRVILQLTGLSRDALHVYAGMAVFLLATAALRKHLRSPLPLLAVCLLAAGMEALDARDDLLTFGYWRAGASLHDVINTMSWPAIIFVMARFTRLFSDHPAGTA